MNIIHNQTLEYGCSFYCISNLLKLDNTTVEKCLAEIETHPEKQMNEFYENEFLRRYRDDIYFLTTCRISKTTSDFITNSELLGCINEPRNMDKLRIIYFAFLASVQLQEAHRILIIRSIYNDLTFIIDPLKKDNIELSCQEVFKMYSRRSISISIDESTGK